MARRNRRRHFKQPDLMPVPPSMDDSPPAAATAAADETCATSEQGDAPPAQAETGVETSGATGVAAGAVTGEDTPASQPVFAHDVAAANAPYLEVGRVSFGRRVAGLARGLKRMLAAGGAGRKARRVAASAPDADVAISAPEEAASITQINERDREYLRHFSPALKAQVMQKISTQAPEENVSYRGANRFEKVMMNLHREGYGLIDLQPHETALSSVWYRKIGRMSKDVEVTMLMWEENEQGDTTTVMRWRI